MQISNRPPIVPPAPPETRYLMQGGLEMGQTEERRRLLRRQKAFQQRPTIWTPEGLPPGLLPPRPFTPTAPTPKQFLMGGGAEPDPLARASGMPVAAPSPTEGGGPTDEVRAPVQVPVQQASQRPPAAYTPVNPLAPRKPRTPNPSGVLGTGGELWRKKGPLRMMAKGGTLKKGEQAIVGEKGPEQITSTERGTQVKPLGNIGNISRGTQTSTFSVSGGPGGTRTLRTTTPTTRMNMGSPEEWRKRMERDIGEQERLITERQRLEQEAKDLQMRGIAGLEQGRGEAATLAGGRAGSIAQAGAMGAAELAGAKGAVAAMPGKVQGAVEEREKRVAGKGEELVARAQEGTQRILGEVRQRGDATVDDAKQMMEAAVAETKGMRDVALSEFADMSAEAMSVGARAINESYEAQKADLVARYNGDPPPHLLARLDSSRAMQVSDLGMKYEIAYNDKMADLRAGYDSVAAQQRTVLEQATMDAQQQSDALVAQVGVAGEQLVNNAGVVALGEEGKITQAGMQYISWAEQNAANMATEVAQASVQFFQQQEQLGMVNEANLSRMNLAYDQLRMAGLGDLADFTANQTLAYVPHAPYYAQMMQYMAQRALWEREMKEQQRGIQINAGLAEGAYEGGRRPQGPAASPVVGQPRGYPGTGGGREATSRPAPTGAPAAPTQGYPVPSPLRRIEA